MLHSRIYCKVDYTSLIVSTLVNIRVNLSINPNDADAGSADREKKAINVMMRVISNDFITLSSLNYD